MKNMKKISTVLLATTAVLALSACSPDGNKEVVKDDKDAKIKLSYAFFAPANSFPGMQMQKFEEEVEKRTNGKVDIELYPGGTLLQADNMYQGVRDGVVDIGLSSPTYEPGKYPLLDISALPVGIPNSEVASKVTYDLIHEFDHDGLKGLQVVTAFSGEPAYIQTKKEMKTMKDLKGLQLRISGANQNVLRTIGISPVGLSQSEVPEALQTGIIDGNVSSREVLKDFQLAVDEKYVIDYPLSTTSFMAVMNEDKFNSLPKDVQKVITEVGNEMVGFTGKYLDNQVKDVMKWSAEEHGVKTVSLSATEKALWDKKFKALSDKTVSDLQAKGLDAEKYQNRMIELIEKYSK